MARFQFYQETVDGSPYWRLGASGSPTWESRKDLQAGLSSDLDIDDTRFTVGANGIRYTPPVTGVITSANRFRKAPALNKVAVDNTWPDTYEDIILKWNRTTDPAVNVQLYTWAMSHHDGTISSTESGHTYFVLIQRAGTGTDLYAVQNGRCFGDDGDNGASSSQSFDTTNLATFDASNVSLVDGDWLRLRVRKRVSGTTIYFRWWLYRIGSSLPASEDDYATAGTMIARHGGSDTTETSYTSSTHNSARRMGFTTLGDPSTVVIDTYWMEANQYTAPVLSVTTNFPSAPFIVKETDDWYYGSLTLGRSGNTNSFTTTPTPPTGVTVEVTSDFGTGNTMAYRYKAGSSASVANGQTLAFSTTDGVIASPATLNVTLGIKAKPGGSGVQTYVSGTHGNTAIPGSSTPYNGKGNIKSARDTRLGGTNAWSSPTFADVANGMLALAGSSLTVSWQLASHSSGLTATLASYCAQNNVRRILTIPPASNDAAGSSTAASVRAAYKVWAQYLNDLGLDVIAIEIGFRGTLSASGNSTNNGVAAGQVVITASGSTLTAVSGTYDNYYVGVTRATNTLAVAKIATHTYDGTNHTLVLSENLQTTPNGVIACEILSPTQANYIISYNQAFEDVANPLHEDFIQNTTFGTRTYFFRGYFNRSRAYWDNSDHIHPIGTGYDEMADELVDAESDYILARTTVTITPSSPDPYVMLPTDDPVDFGATIVPTFFNVAALPGTMQGTETDRWSLVSGAGGVGANDGVYTPSGEGSAVIKRSLPVWHTSTVTVPGGTRNLTVTAVSGSRRRALLGGLLLRMRGRN